MNLSLLVLNIISVFAAITMGATITSKKDYHENPASVPSVFEAARIARTLVQRESLGNLATIDKENFPVSFSEYYVDGFSTGDPVLILLNISSTYRNIKNSKDGKLSFSIRTGDHQPNDRVNSHYPGGIAFSTAGSPRIILKGKVERFDIQDPVQRTILEAKFVKRHPDAKFWLPSSKVSAHSGFWAKVVVESIYFIGGFGDRAFIGDIPVEIYHQAEPLSDSEFANFLSDLQEKNTNFQNLVTNYQIPSAL